MTPEDTAEVRRIFREEYRKQEDIKLLQSEILFCISTINSILQMHRLASEGQEIPPPVADLKFYEDRVRDCQVKLKALVEG